jgi:hypothetical protein
MALLPLIHDGIVSLFAMALLPLSSKCRHLCCKGIFVIIDVQLSLPSSQWHLLEECNPIVLVLTLTLVLVGRLPAGARGSKNLFY